MSKKLLKVMCLTLATIASLSFFAGCNKGNGGTSSDGDTTETVETRNENKALVFSSGEFDGIFNPFFGTSAYDTGVTGQTQISMLSADDTGNSVTFGKDEPVYSHQGFLPSRSKIPCFLLGRIHL